MASHNVPRAKPTGPKTGDARQKELMEIERYKSLVTEMNENKSQGIYNADLLQLTSKLLKENPEYYSVWNYRRRILKHLMQETENVEREDVVRTYLTSDMEFLLPLLIKFPKCYWIWNHRSWLLQQTSSSLPIKSSIEFWQHELVLVEKMHARDSRNFHGWNYRRKVISELRNLMEQQEEQSAAVDTDVLHAESKAKLQLSMTEKEFSYTTKMIQSNLSNFSAWHSRSVLIPRLLDERGANARQRKEFFMDELKLIENGILLDPADQSLWYYHEFLVEQINPRNESGFVAFNNIERCSHLEDQIIKIREVLEDTEDCKWIYQHLLEYGSIYLEIESGNKLFTTREMQLWLLKLNQLDSLRKERWEYMANKLGL